MRRAAPEHPKSLVKQRQIGLAMHQEGARRQAEIAATAADGDVLRGAYQVQHIGGAEVQAQPPQGFPEQQQVGQNRPVPGVGGGGVQVDGGGSHHGYDDAVPSYETAAGAASATAGGAAMLSVCPSG